MNRKFAADYENMVMCVLTENSARSDVAEQRRDVLRKRLCVAPRRCPQLVQRPPEDGHLPRRPPPPLTRDR